MKSIFRRARWGCLISVLAIILALGGLSWAVNRSPRFGAQGADALRRVFGARLVAALEMVVLRIQDAFTKLQYDLGLKKPAAPWKVALVTATAVKVIRFPTPEPTHPPSTTVPAHTATPTPTITPSPLAPAGSTQAGSTPIPTLIITPAPASTPAPTPTITPAPPSWPPLALTPLGTLEGEGIWSAYIQAVDGRIVSYRTFLQPDPKRLYAVAAIIAFNLTSTRLHYVLGSVEPYSPDSPKRSGEMPAADKAPGVLLALFNGGFKAVNGHYGAMSGGVVALPPKDGLGAIAIYKNGSVRMGAWGTDIQPTDDLEAWRENGPLVVHQGVINPKIYDNSPVDWGYTVNNVSPTWRSGIGLSSDGNTLFYFAGSSLTMEALARVMVTAGAQEALQLDINGYWVHFVAVRTDGVNMSLDPLFPGMMKENIDRYLYPYTRDFFYVTAKP